MPDPNDFFIEVDSEGNSVGHPHHYKNLLAIYPDHDFSTGVPAKYEPFKIVPAPHVGIYERLVDHDAIGALTDEHPELIKVDGYWQENWVVIPFTAEEKKQAQDDAKALWEETGYKVTPSWIHNLETNIYEPPVPVPSDELEEGKMYKWDEETTSWQVVDI